MLDEPFGALGALTRETMAIGIAAYLGTESPNHAHGDTQRRGGGVAGGAITGNAV